MRRIVTHARMTRLRAILHADAEAEERRAAQDAKIERAQACYAAEAHLRELVQARGIDSYTRDEPWRATCPTMYTERNPTAFMQTLPVRTLFALVNGADIAAEFPLHAQAWADADSLTRDEWDVINRSARLWGPPYL